MTDIDVIYTRNKEGEEEEKTEYESLPLFSKISTQSRSSLVRHFHQVLRKCPVLVGIAIIIIIIIIASGCRHLLNLAGLQKTTLTEITAEDIYCRGPILHAIQTELPNRDGKDFVDRPMKYDPTIVKQHFEQLNGDHSIERLTLFLESNFDTAGSDLVSVVPSDWENSPAPLSNAIKNETLKDWALELNALWKVLGRQPQLENKNRHSFLPTQHLLMVPGGRFRESYYWDSYWIVHGLLACDMYDTARGVVQNLLDFVDLYGYVPNGGRIYYLTRTQPPMLSEMVRILHGYRQDVDFLKQATALLDKEYQFWMTQGEHGHAIQIQKPHEKGRIYTLNRYVSKATEPRPESYREDMTTASAADKGRSSSSIFAEIIAACESGWDFSSRWLRNGGAYADTDNSTSAQLRELETSNIIPVDLNTMMHRMEQTMAHFHHLLGDSKQSAMYTQAADSRLDAIQAILWDDSAFMWRDYRIEQGAFSPVLSASNYFPLWSLDNSKTNATLLNGIRESFEASTLFQEGGVRTTTVKTGQQWDSPNAWPPIQDILIESFLRYNETEDLGKTLIRRWLHSNLVEWKSSGHQGMLEKYNAFGIGQGGGGGEYISQVGFGWTNGVVLKLLINYADWLDM